MKTKIRYLLLITSILSFSFTVTAQDQTIDSLRLALKYAKHDTTKLNIEIELEEAKYNMRIPYWDSLAKRALKLNFKNSESHALNNIGVIYNNQGNNIKALEYYNLSLSIDTESKNKAGIANNLNNIGFVYYYQGDIPKSLDFFLKSLKIEKEIKNKDGIANALNNIGNIYLSLGDVTKALDCFHNSLKIQEEINDKNGMAASLTNIGLIYEGQDNITKGIEYHTKSLKLYEEINNKKGIAMLLNNLGACSAKQLDNTKALDYYNKSMLIMESLNDKAGIALSYNNIGNIYCSKSDIDNAIKQYSKSLAIYEEINDRKGISHSLNCIASALSQDKNSTNAKTIKALELAKRSLAIAKELKFPENICWSATTLKRIYKKQNKFKEALEMYELEIQMRDSINNMETKKASIKKQFQYQYEKKAAADSVVNAEEQKVKNAQLTAQQAQLKQEKTQRFALYGGLVLVIAFAGFVFNRFKITQKQKVIIENQKAEVDKAYVQLHEKNKEVMDSILYARRIQRALLTPERYITKHLARLANERKA